MIYGTCHAIIAVIFLSSILYTALMKLLQKSRVHCKLNDEYLTRKEADDSINVMSIVYIDERIVKEIS